MSYTIHVLETTVALMAVDVARQGGAVRLTWPSAAGRTYRVEYAEHLGAWVPLGEDHLAEGVALTILDSMASSPQRFYRVLGLR